jgi:pullulanase/glycogen debranching enzyme
MNGTGYKDVTWLNPAGESKSMSDWGVERSGAFSMMIHRETSSLNDSSSGFLLFFFNARQENVTFNFPAEPDFSWECLIDTVHPEGNPSSDRIASGQPVDLPARSMQIWREFSFDPMG